MYHSGAPILYVIGGYRLNAMGQQRIYTTISVLHPTDDDSGPLAVTKVISLNPAYGDAGVWGAGVATMDGFVYIAGGCVGTFGVSCSCSGIVSQLDTSTDVVQSLSAPLNQERCEPRMGITQAPRVFYVIGGWHRAHMVNTVIKTVEVSSDEGGAWDETGPCQYANPADGTLDRVRFGVAVSQDHYTTTPTTTGTTTVTMTGTTTVTMTGTTTPTTTATTTPTKPGASSPTHVSPTVTRAYAPGTKTAKKKVTERGWFAVLVTVAVLAAIGVVIYCMEKRKQPSAERGWAMEKRKQPSAPRGWANDRSGPPSYTAALMSDYM